jgi:hypothetical protein
VFVKNGYNPNDNFTICIYDPEGTAKSWIMGTTYNQSAWAYNSSTITLPGNKQKKFGVTLDKRIHGNNSLSFYVVAFK